MLEVKVDEKYFISSAMMDYFMGVNQKPSKFPRRERFLANINRKDQDRANSVTTNAGQRPTDNFVKEPFVVASRGRNPQNPSDRTTGTPTVQRLEPKFDGTTNTLTSVQKDNYVAIRTANSTGYDMATDGDGVDLAYPESSTRRGRVGHGVSKTLPTSDSQGVLDGVRIRKLTPKECWRLMGFNDEDFEKAERVNSNTQLYKQAGNSIVVDVLGAILTNLLKGGKNEQRAKIQSVG